MAGVKRVSKASPEVRLIETKTVVRRVLRDGYFSIDLVRSSDSVGLQYADDSGSAVYFDLDAIPKVIEALQAFYDER